MSAKSHAWYERLVPLLQGIGPYAAVALLLPGGGLVALALWAYRQRTRLLPARLRAGLRSQWQRIAKAPARWFAPPAGLVDPHLPLVTQTPAAMAAAAPRTATCPGTQRRSFRCIESTTPRR